MTDQTYWVVRLEALSFKTKREADAFRNKMKATVMDMPESADLTLASSLLERGMDYWPVWTSATVTIAAQSQIKAAEAAALKKAAGNPTREECYSAALSRDHSLGLKSQKEKNDAILKAEWWFLAWRHRILALIDDQQSSALDEYVKAKVGEALEWAADQVKYTERSVSRLDIAAAIRAMKE